MKIWTSERHRLNTDILSRYGRAATPQEADWCICWKDVPPGADPERTILIQTEPPITPRRRWLYETFREFHTVLRYDPKADNEFPLDLTGDTLHLYPYSPRPRRRESAEFYSSSTGAYFAGKRDGAEGDRCGYPVQYRTRANIAEQIAACMGGVCKGKGWPQSTKKHAEDGWHKAKMREIREGNYRYVLAIENCRMPGYISEKLWDGLLSDRVTLYLGAPDVHRYIDPCAFVDLSLWLDDIAGLCEMLPRLDHDVIRDAASGVVHAIGDRPRRIQERVTQFVCDRMEGQA